MLKKIKRKLKAYYKVRTGQIGENKACNYLKRQGYFIWKRNWRCRFGELDIIAYNNKILRFIEVKTRKTSSVCDFPALDAITQDKFNRLERLARAFVKRYSKQMRIRRLRSTSIDAITVIYQSGVFRKPEITHFQNLDFTNRY